MAVTRPLTLAHGFRSPPRSLSRRMMVPRKQISQIQTPVRRRTPRIAGIGPGDGRPRCIASAVSSLPPSAGAPRYARSNLGGTRRRGWYVAIGPPSGPCSIRRRRRSARAAPRRAAPRRAPPRHARRQQRSARDPLTPPPSVLRSRCVTPVTSRPPLATRPLRQPWCAPGPDWIRRYRRPVTPRRVTPAPSSAPLAIRAPCRHRSPVRAVLRSPPAPPRQRRSARVAPGPLPAALRQRPGHAASAPAPQLKIGPRSMPAQRPAPTPAGRTCVAGA